MRRLLKIREFFDLKKKRSLEEDSSISNRQAKRLRKGTKPTDAKADETSTLTPSSPPVNRIEKGYERFLQVFEKDKGGDSVWWLPGRRGEAFAMHRERFEHNILKVHLEEHSFSDFVEELKRWGFQQMNIPSLSGRIVAFENSSKSALRCSFSKSSTESGVSSQNREHGPRGHSSAATNAPLTQTGATSSQGDTSSANLASMTSLQLQQAHYMVQQEIAHSYFNLLWQELQRQLSVLLLHQSQPNSTPIATTPRSEILDLATLLQQQQVQQQLMTAQLIHAAVSQPSTALEQQTVVQELSELQQQQLSNLTYQIVALVAANLEQQNQPAQSSDESAIPKILVKYMIALVLLQLQQQQHNLEFLRQERMTALALARSVDGGAEGAALPDPLNVLQMQQLLSEAAMLSLSRAHQLLCEAAILIPTTASAPVQQVPPTPPPSRNAQSPLPGSGFGPHPPRTTTAR